MPYHMTRRAWYFLTERRYKASVQRIDLGQWKWTRSEASPNDDPDERKWIFWNDNLDKRQRRHMERKYGRQCAAYNPDCVVCVAWAYALDWRTVPSTKRFDRLWESTSTEEDKG